MRIAALQFKPRFLDTQHNLKTIEQRINSIESDLIVLPELCLSGYYFASQEQVALCAESLDGETNQKLFSMAQKKRCAIVVGFAEQDEGRIYNSAAFITPDGIQGVYQKTHLFGEEKIWFTPGNTGFKVFSFRSVNIGIMICYDWRFPEAARSLALNGSDIICHPSNLITDGELWKTAMRTRSIENKIITITANRTGQESKDDSMLTFTGCSQIANEHGTILAEMNNEDEGFITADINPEATRNKSISKWNDIVNDRRPDLYK